MLHFFISYAKKDTRELALQLNEALNALPNVTAWVDKSLRAGQSWELQIQREIDRCGYMIVLYSPDINRHKRGEEESYMLSEIHYAKRVARKQIIPVMAQRTEPPMSLITEQFIDFTLPNLHLDDLITAICDETGISVREGLIPPAAPTPILTKPTTLSLMPAPFAWIEIPGKGYSIAKYPITNGQFAKFIEAGGYENRQWWTELGWNYRQKNQWNHPQYWTDKNFNGLEQPVVGVSWYEAAAFCLWLSAMTSEKIMLPTNEQWRYAAQGDDGRNYPWGKQWDVARCNNNVDDKGIGRTTSVIQYEDIGCSFFGVVDMAGNVQEWCLTDYRYGTDDINSNAAVRDLVSSSWESSNIDSFCCRFRNYGQPNIRLITAGFRICRS